MMRLLMARARTRKGSVLMFGFLIIAIVMITLLPSLMAIGQAVDSNVAVLTQAQSAAYAASGVTEEVDGRLRINSAAAKQRALDVISENVGRNVAGDPDFDIEIYVHNPNVDSVRNSQAIDPNCDLAPVTQEDAPCWRDTVVGAYHRTPGVTVIINQTIDQCFTWSFLILEEGETGCAKTTVTGYGYAEFTTQSIEPENDITFSLSGPDPIVDERTATLDWTITGNYAPNSVKCIIDNQPTFCGPYMSGASGSITRDGFAPGKHTFRVQVQGQYGISTSSTWTWIVRTPPNDFWVDGDLDYDPELTRATATWQLGGSGTVDVGASGCVLTTYFINSGALRSQSDVPCMSGSGNGPWTYTMDRNQLAEGVRYELTVTLNGTEGQSASETYTWDVRTIRQWRVGGWQRTNLQLRANDPIQGILFQVVDSIGYYDIDYARSGCTLQFLDIAGAVVSQSSVSTSRCFGEPDAADGVTSDQGWFKMSGIRHPVNTKPILIVHAVSQGSGLDSWRTVPGNPEEPRTAPGVPQWIYNTRSVRGLAGFNTYTVNQIPDYEDYNGNGNTTETFARLDMNLVARVTAPDLSRINGVNSIMALSNYSCAIRLQNTNGTWGGWQGIGCSYNYAAGQFESTVRFSQRGKAAINNAVNGRVYEFRAIMGLAGGNAYWSTTTVSDYACSAISSSLSGSTLTITSNACQPQNNTSSPSTSQLI